jgi:hypothetical protein
MDPWMHTALSIVSIFIALTSALVALGCAADAREARAECAQDITMLSKALRFHLQSDLRREGVTVIDDKLPKVFHLPTNKLKQ